MPETRYRTQFFLTGEHNQASRRKKYMHTTPGQFMQMRIENSRDGFLSEPRVGENGKVESRASLTAGGLGPSPPQQIDCRVKRTRSDYSRCLGWAGGKQDKKRKMIDIQDGRRKVINKMHDALICRDCRRVPYEVTNYAVALELLDCVLATT